MSHGEILLPELTTPRLRLRPPRLGEEVALAAALNTSLDNLRPWLAFAQRPSTPAQLRSVITTARAHIAAGELLQWRLWWPERRELAGSIDVHNLDWSVPKGEVGYWLRSSAAGHGLAAEAVHRVMQYLLGERGFARVEARCDARNLRAQRVVTRLGFTREGIARHDERDVNGELADLAVYAMCGLDELRPMAD
jgi:RimJ/RimL family protein N-acetyltransferase